MVRLSLKLDLLADRDKCVISIATMTAKESNEDQKPASLRGMDMAWDKLVGQIAHAFQK